MFKRTERISFRISSVLSKVKLEPGAGPSHRLWLRPESTGSGSTTLLPGVNDSAESEIPIFDANMKHFRAIEAK